ncbi:hypothetical protein ACLKA7_017168 [Drosophila subpalustris]
MSRRSGQGNGEEGTGSWEGLSLISIERPVNSLLPSRQSPGNSYSPVADYSRSLRRWKCKQLQDYGQDSHVLSIMTIDWVQFINRRGLMPKLKRTSIRIHIHIRIQSALKWRLFLAFIGAHDVVLALTAMSINCK